MSDRRVLVVEDEAPIRELLRLHLGLNGFHVDEAADGRAALNRSRNTPFDLLILDLMLPGLDGVSLCRAIRNDGPNADAPILMITARDAEADKVLGLESGADDYITKPFAVRELVARIGAVMRRHSRTAAPKPPETVRCGGLVLDTGRREARVRGTVVPMTRQEFDLLLYLATHQRVVFSRSALLQNVWQEDTYVTERTVDTVISRLRRKVERDPHNPRTIVTAWGVGYKCLPDDDDGCGRSMENSERPGLLAT